MSYLVSVSGAAGTGKSTLLSNLKYPVDSFRVARYVLQDMGMDLYEIVKHWKTTIHFQEAILDYKVRNDSHLKSHEDKWIFVERCPADFYAFACTWQQNFNEPEYNRWLEEYKKRCLQAMKIYDVAIILEPGHFAHVDDGVRAKADTQEVTNKALNECLSRHWGNVNFRSPKFYLHRVQVGDIIERVQEVDKVLIDAEEYFNTYAKLPNL